MNLTPIAPDLVPSALAVVRANLDVSAIPAFGRIAHTFADMATPTDTRASREAALMLVNAVGMPIVDEAPTDAFSWDGRAVRMRSEASVLVHEVAHWLIAPDDRRALPDFGLGAGPETGRIEEANAARCVDDTVKEEEELLASLLGILFEAVLGQLAIHSFIEQNWLEAWERKAAAEQFSVATEMLRARNLIDRTGMPILFQEGNAAIAEISIKNSGQASAETSTIADAGPSLGK